jgi:hypothetical protein
LTGSRVSKFIRKKTRETINIRILATIKLFLFGIGIFP